MAGMDADYLARIVGATGIPEAYLKYDTVLSDFISMFFSSAKDSSLDIVLYGGTAMNRGFFKEKQRLSVDLDLETGSDAKTEASRISGMLSRRGISCETPPNAPGLVIARAGEGVRIRVEVTAKKFNIETKAIDLVPLSGYLGLPSAITYGVPSYPFDYLMARKLNALSRRLIYKDIYDVFIGLDMARKSALKRYVKMVGGDFDIIGDVLHYLRGGAFDKKDPFGYRSLTQLRYRKSEDFMANEIVSRLERIF